MKKFNTTLLIFTISASILIVSIASYQLIIAKAYSIRTDADFKEMIMLMNMSSTSNNKLVVDI